MIYKALPSDILWLIGCAYLQGKIRQSTLPAGYSATMTSVNKAEKREWLLGGSLGVTAIVREVSPSSRILWLQLHIELLHKEIATNYFLVSSFKHQLSVPYWIVGNKCFALKFNSSPLPKNIMYHIPPPDFFFPLMGNQLCPQTKDCCFSKLCWTLIDYDTIQSYCKGCQRISITSTWQIWSQVYSFSPLKANVFSLS